MHACKLSQEIIFINSNLIFSTNLSLSAQNRSLDPVLSKKVQNDSILSAAESNVRANLQTAPYRLVVEMVYAPDLSIHVSDCIASRS